MHMLVSVNNILDLKSEDQTWANVPSRKHSHRWAEGPD